MESFYRMMRKKHDLMMVNGQPDGGKWNFDHNNRKNGMEILRYLENLISPKT